MKKFLSIAIILLIASVVLMAGCSDNSTSGSLKVRVVDDDSIRVIYSFKGVPKAVDNGQVYLNGNLVGSKTGSGKIVFDNIEPNTTFVLTTATMTLATVIYHK